MKKLSKKEKASMLANVIQLAVFQGYSILPFINLGINKIDFDKLEILYNDLKNEYFEANNHEFEEAY